MGAAIWAWGSWNDNLAAGIDDPPDVARQRAWSRDGDDLLPEWLHPNHPLPGGHHLATSNHIIKHRLSLHSMLGIPQSFLLRGGKD